MRIIDSHLHFSSKNAEDEWKTLTAALGKSGIGGGILSNVFCGGAYPTEMELREGNAYAARQCALSGGILRHLVYLNPQLACWRQVLADGMAAKAVGIKLWLALKDEKGGSSLENAKAVLKEAAQLKLPVLIHVFNRTGGNLPGEVNMEEFLQLAQSCPECTMIAAHSGGNLHASAGLIKRCPQNVYFDICGTAPESGMLERMLRETGTERLLYGSDGLGRSLDSQLQKIFDANLSAEQQEDILWRNAARIYHLPEPKDLPCPMLQRQALREDYFVFCGTWPFCRLPRLKAGDLEEAFVAQGTEAGWTVSLEAAVSADVLEENLRFGEECRGLRRVRPLAVCNPLDANAAAVLSAALEAERFAGVWFSPYLHGYEPSLPRFLKLLECCAQRKVRVFLNFSLGEYRFRPSLLKCREASTEEIEQLLPQLPDNDYVLQGTGCLRLRHPRKARVQLCASRMADRQDGIATYTEQDAALPLVHGSEFPFRSLYDNYSEPVSNCCQSFCFLDEIPVDEKTTIDADVHS